MAVKVVPSYTPKLEPQHKFAEQTFVGQGLVSGGTPYMA